MRISGSLRAALDAVDEPILLVAADARIEHRNRCARKLPALAARTHVVAHDRQAELDFLARCRRSARILRGSIRLSSVPGGDAASVSCRGRRVRLAPDAPFLVLLRLLPIDGTDRLRRSGAVDRKQLRRLIDRARRDERERIARDLHDQAGQQILSLKLGLGRLRQSRIDATQAAVVEGLIGHVDAIVQDLQRTITCLRPPALDAVGLEQALGDLVERWSEASGISAALHVIGETEALAKPAEAALFRLLQEALTNVAKHAVGASTVSIALQHAAGRATLTIQDDGEGLPRGADTPAFLTHRGKFGLAGMRERLAHLGGELELRSTGGRDHGTTIVARVRTGSARGKRRGGEPCR